MFTSSSIELSGGDAVINPAGSLSVTSSMTANAFNIDLKRKEVNVLTSTGVQNALTGLGTGGELRLLKNNYVGHGSSVTLVQDGMWIVGSGGWHCLLHAIP